MFIVRDDSCKLCKQCWLFWLALWNVYTQVCLYISMFLYIEQVYYCMTNKSYCMSMYRIVIAYHNIVFGMETIVQKSFN